MLARRSLPMSPVRFSAMDKEQVNKNGIIPLGYNYCPHIDHVVIEQQPEAMTAYY